MIVKMSKIEIVGPRDLLLQALTLMRNLGVLHIEEDSKRIVDRRQEPELKSLLMDKQTLSKRLFFEDLLLKIDLLADCLPKTAGRETFLNPPSAVEAVTKLVEGHTKTCRELALKITDTQQELENLSRLESFFTSIEPLVREVGPNSGLDFLGLELKDPSALEPLSVLVHRLTKGSYEIHTSDAPTGDLIVLIATEKGLCAPLKQALRSQKLPDMALPGPLDALPFAEKLPAIRKEQNNLLFEAGLLQQQLSTFAQRWRPIYQSVRNWLADQLGLLQKTASLFETRMCFFIFGWIPTRDLEQVKKSLNVEFSDQVVLEEKELLEEDLETVPVALKNPAYFQPFELFSRLLPLPRYTSFDPTTFLGLFFPLFFGMILGDLGYGVILLAIALALITLVRKKAMVRDAAKILSVAALYTIIFGLFYGECFGELGSHALGLEPICFDRRTAVLPMLYFALSVGVFHVLLGLLLGFVTALKRRQKKEAWFKLLSCLVILCVLVLLLSFFAPFTFEVRQPLLTALGIILPVLILSGGLLAPLELLKTFGNIISYARIMAVGLTSVLLAYVANQLGGATGDILMGILVAVILHTFNLVLGVFAPWSFSANSWSMAEENSNR